MKHSKNCSHCNRSKCIVITIETCNKKSNEESKKSHGVKIKGNTNEHELRKTTSPVIAPDVPKSEKPDDKSNQSPSQHIMMKVPSQCITGKQASQHSVKKVPSRRSMGKEDSQPSTKKVPSQSSIGKVPSQRSVGKEACQHSMKEVPSRHTMGKEVSQHSIKKMLSQCVTDQEGVQCIMKNMPSRGSIGKVPSQCIMEKMGSHCNTNNMPSQSSMEKEASQHSTKKVPSQCSMVKEPNQYSGIAKEASEHSMKKVPSSESIAKEASKHSTKKVLSTEIIAKEASKHSTKKVPSSESIAKEASKHTTKKVPSSESIAKEASKHSTKTVPSSESIAKEASKHSTKKVPSTEIIAKEASKHSTKKMPSQCVMNKEAAQCITKDMASRRGVGKVPSQSSMEKELKKEFSQFSPTKTSSRHSMDKVETRPSLEDVKEQPKREIGDAKVKPGEEKMAPLPSSQHQRRFKLPLLINRHHGQGCAMEISVLERHEESCIYKKEETEGRTIDDRVGSYDCIGRMVFRTCNSTDTESEVSSMAYHGGSGGDKNMVELLGPMPGAGPRTNAVFYFENRRGNGGLGTSGKQSYMQPTTKEQLMMARLMTPQMAMPMHKSRKHYPGDGCKLIPPKDPILTNSKLLEQVFVSRKWFPVVAKKNKQTNASSQTDAVLEWKSEAMPSQEMIASITDLNKSEEKRKLGFLGSILRWTLGGRLIGSDSKK